MLIRNNKQYIYIAIGVITLALIIAIPTACLIKHDSTETAQGYTFKDGKLIDTQGNHLSSESKTSSRKDALFSMQSGKDVEVLDDDPIQYTKEYLAKVYEKVKEQRKRRLAWKLSQPNRSLVFNESYSQEFKDINTKVYQITERYFNKQTFSGVPCSKYVDPIYIMAISNVEFGGFTSPDVLLAPAVPTLKGAKVTSDNITTFGYTDYLQISKLIASDRDEYRGVLQMYVTGMTDHPAKPEDLVGNEYTRLLTAPDSPAKTAELSSLQFVEGSGIGSRFDGNSVKNREGNYGDRFNYGDSVNRLSGFIANQWKLYYGTSSICKDGDYAIDNKFAWMALTSISHNSSPAVLTMGDNKSIHEQYWWFPYTSMGNVRKYCHALGQPECLTIIQDKALTNLQEYRSGSPLKFRLTRQEGMAIANDLISRGYVPKDLWVCTVWNHEEKIAYPIQLLYNYFLLDAIYSGK